LVIARLAQAGGLGGLAHAAQPGCAQEVADIADLE